MLQLVCAWNLAHAPVRCVAPTLIQESGPDARPIEDKRAELAALSAGGAGAAGTTLSAGEGQAIRAIGENTGCMALKGASVEHSGGPPADRWGLDGDLAAPAAPGGVDRRRALP